MTVIPVHSGGCWFGHICQEKKKRPYPIFATSAECSGRSAARPAAKQRTPGRPTGHLSSARGNLHTNIIRIISLRWPYAHCRCAVKSRDCCTQHLQSRTQSATLRVQESITRPPCLCLKKRASYYMRHNNVTLKIFHLFLIILFLNANVGWNLQN
jgi:hypothetical protein